MFTPQGRCLSDGRSKCDDPAGWQVPEAGTFGVNWSGVWLVLVYQACHCQRWKSLRYLELSVALMHWRLPSLTIYWLIPCCSVCSVTEHTEQVT